MFSFASLRRKRLRHREFPPGWLAAIERNVPVYRLLPAAGRHELLGHVQVFLAEKQFAGAGDLAVDDEMRATIAAQACIPLLNRPRDYYPRLSSLVIYAGEYLAPVREVDEAGVVTEGILCRSGESWEGGAIALSWEDVLLAGVPGEDDYNVVIHEVAHQLDQEDGISDAMLLAGEGETVAALGRLLAEAYAELAADVAAGREPVFDPYGAETPAEFFAVTVECFFGLPQLLSEWYPDLYRELAGYFGQDPVAQWRWPA